MPMEGEWKIDVLWDADETYIIRNGDNAIVADSMSKDDARRIVAAVNCHEDLVALVEDFRLITQVERDTFACKCLFEEPSPSHAEVVRKYNDRLDHIDAALAKAREGVG